MTNFKEQEGKLFRMLEEHEIVPLKEKDTNVLVRFITHGVIGEYVMEHWLDCNQKNVPIFVDSVDIDGDVTVCIENGHYGCPFPMFQIIGTHVKEGSADWALHQMMQGKKVFRAEWECDMYCQYTNNEIITFRDGIPSTINPVEEWIANAKRADFGWQIYKEPELKYKAGDFVEIRNWYSGTKHLAQIDSIDHEIHIGSHRFDTNGNSTMERLPQLKIIRKLKPSQVVVEIGCLSGAVKDLSYVEDGRFWFIGKKTERCPGGMHCILYLEMLDTQTRELVEGLLEAQQEEQSD
jgi:hypothetical protein